MEEYIHNNPELEHTNKRIIICKPFRIRKRDTMDESPPQKHLISPRNERIQEYPSK